MKAILLAGGYGTRLRPLTLNTPKPIVPIFDRPLLYHQIDLLKQLPDIDEVILSLNYQPQKVEALVGNGKETGLRIRHVVESTPLGTGGAIRYAAPYLDGTVVVFNGDVLSNIDLSAVLELHRNRKARATIVLTPVDDPSSYGVVETDAKGNVLRFLEKPSPDQITCNTINAGIYILEPETLNRIPPDINYSVEHQYFPSLIEERDTFVAYIDKGYWIDIGTPEKYLQAHRDIMSGQLAIWATIGHPLKEPLVHPQASVDVDANLRGPCFIGAEVKIEAKVKVAPNSVICSSTIISSGAEINGSIIWPNTFIGPNAVVRDAIIGQGAKVEAHANIGPGVVLGDNSVISSYSRLP